ncbi:MAG: glycosyltransferase family 2 protein [Synechococcales cyanobacterium RM1_1_8]|nr:glycosyltransferase family 2 protein [Synechococcales cyanobacterium RM1_1_8]
MMAAIRLRINPPPAPLPQETARLLWEDLNDWEVVEWDDLPSSYRQFDRPLELAIALENNDIAVHWETPFPDDAPPIFPWPQQLQAYDWPDSPTILALVPHRGCEPWLRRCLTSLVQQTHAPSNIVVIDDASPQPPLEIIQGFESVTLLTAAEQVGPYGLIQAVIDRTDYDAYLFQDADDWSTGDRLATLLATARSQGAELVGSQEIRILEPELQLQAVGYPPNVTQALNQGPGHPLLHPTSLVTRDLVQRLGGFATGLRFGGDTEFLLRAHWRARLVNSPRYCYFRRKRPGSLTTAAATGLGSPPQTGVDGTTQAAGSGQCPGSG